VLRYGNARELCLGLEVVLPTGEIWDGLRGLRKNNTGYSLRDLYVGAEGTLGVITAAVLKLFPLPTTCHTALVALTNLRKSTDLLSRARAASHDNLTSFELMGRTCIGFAVEHIPGCRDPFDFAPEWYVLLVFSSGEGDEPPGQKLQDMLESALQDEVISDAAIASSETQAQAFWRLREGLVEAQKFEGGSIKHDVSVPVSQVPAFIELANDAVTARVAGIRPCVFGHLGDGNIHYNLSQPKSMTINDFKALKSELNHLVYDIVADKGGSFSAEHGVGILKLSDMSRYKPDIELQVMGQIKAALDPRGIMNPGKVLPATAAKTEAGLTS
jgi:D-lactate dehydrogenase (cytochrome)